MSDRRPYTHLGGGQGEVVPPGTLADDYAEAWRIRCFLWTGSERWSARRHTPAPAQAKEYGVRDEHACWHEPPMRRWLQDQAEAVARWDTAQQRAT